MKSRAEELFEVIRDGGVAAIERYVHDQISEDLFIDFKVSTDDGAGTKLHERDHKNFAKALTGFGNSEGGIIIWGVKCQNVDGRGDLPTELKPISYPQRFIANLEGIASGCTVPPHRGARHHAIQKAANQGYVVSYIPVCPFRPLRMQFRNESHRYLIRTGSSFTDAPHALLASMFGSFPAPEVSLGIRSRPGSVQRTGSEQKWQVNVSIDIVLRNTGVVLLRDMYVNTTFQSPGGHFGYNGVAQLGWSGETHQYAYHVLSSEERRLAPQAASVATSLNVYFGGPLSDDFVLTFTFGASGAPVHTVEARVPMTDLEGYFASGTAAGSFDPRRLAQIVFKDLPVD